MESFFLGAANMLVGEEEADQSTRTRFCGKSIGCEDDLLSVRGASLLTESVC